MKYLILFLGLSFFSTNSRNINKAVESYFDFAVDEISLIENTTGREMEDEEAFIVLNNIYMMCESERI